MRRYKSTKWKKNQKWASLLALKGIIIFSLVCRHWCLKAYAFWFRLRWRTKLYFVFYSFSSSFFSLLVQTHVCHVTHRDNRKTNANMSRRWACCSRARASDRPLYRQLSAVEVVHHFTVAAFKSVHSNRQRIQYPSFAFRSTFRIHFTDAHRNTEREQINVKSSILCQKRKRKEMWCHMNENDSAAWRRFFMCLLSKVLSM